MPRKNYRVFAIRHEGAFAIGGVSVVVAADLDEAFSLLNTELEDHGLPVNEFGYEYVEIDTLSPGVDIIQGEDY